MEYLKLKEVADYSELRTNHITIENYITTENMLPNIGGICLTNSIPDCKTAKYYEEHDILLSNIRPYFCKIWYANKSGSASNDILVIKNKKSINSKFLYYVLCDKNFFNYATATSKGTKMPRGTPNAIMNYFVPNIDIKTQNKIASILSAYDDLIEKNNRRMEILRGCAEELYKEWFVRFRFPNWQNTKFKDSTLGKIPNDFNVVKMIDIFDNYIGGGWGNDEENVEYCVPAYVIRGTDFPYVMKGDISTCPCRWHKKSNYKSRQLQPQDIVIEISGGTAEQPVGRVILIDEDLLEQFDSKVICASFCKKISLKQDKISSIYFYYWMKFLYDTRIIDKFQLQSTGIINFKFDYFLRQGDVLLPPKLLMDKFCDNVSVIRKNISKIANQNELLKQQRDLLLPRLMSGKINVTP